MLSIEEDKRLSWDELFNHELFHVEKYDENNHREIRKFEPIQDIGAAEEDCPDMTHIINKNQLNKAAIERIEKMIEQ